MKKIVYRDILGNNPRKKEVSVEEITQKPEVTIRKKRICKYFIEDRFFSKNVKEVKRWIAAQKRSSAKKDCHVLRELNTATGDNKIICKVLGDFYVVWGHTAYKIVYVNEIKVTLEGNSSGMKRWQRK